MNSFVHASLSLAVACALAALPAHAVRAQAAASTPPADADKALADAQAELARAARRVAELSRGQANSAVRAMRHITFRPVLGVLLAQDERSGVRVAGVTPDSGADKAGLRAGDRIVSVDGRDVLGSSGELRVRNLRALLGKLEAGKASRIGYVRDGRTASVNVVPASGRSMFVIAGENAGTGADLDFDFDALGLPAIPADVHREILRLGPACKDDECAMPALRSAFRWNGLNLAQVDGQLGRYFGTDRGVLVLSNGTLDGLQAGDVIQRIDGKAVTNPREAMAAMGGKPGGASVSVDYLRDRKQGKAQVTVPKLAPLPLPPAPPAPPKAPKPPSPPAAPQAVTAPMPPVAPHAPLAPDGAGVLGQGKV